MSRSLTLNGVTFPRILSFIAGLGMIVASAMTIEHYFAANFPETIFWSGAEETKRYTIELLKSDAPGSALVISFTEMGPWGAVTDEAERAFKEGTLAVLEAIEEVGNYPISR